MQSFKALSSRLHHHRFTHASSRSIASLLAIVAAFTLPAVGRSQTTLSSFEDTSNVQQDVFYRGTDQHIYFRYFNSTQGWQVQDVTQLSGAPLAAPATAVSSFNDDAQDQQHVVFEAANGHIYQAYSTSNPTQWSFQDLTSLTASAGAAVATPLVTYSDSVTEIQYIFYIGLNQDINVLYWHGSWTAEDASSVANAVPAALGSQLAGFRENQSHTSHIFYEGADQHIHELYAGLDPTAVATTDNTAESGATPTAVGSFLAGNFDNTHLQENVFFVGIDQHIHHLSFTYPATSWQAEDVTALANGPAAALGSSLSSFRDEIGNQQHVFFVGVDQHLHQFYYSDAWYPDDLTADVGAPIPALNSPLTSFKDDPDNQQHAFYLGADDHFYHFYFNTAWSLQDLTAGATVPAF